MNSVALAWLGVGIGAIASLLGVALVVFVMLRRRPRVFLRIRRVWEGPPGKNSSDEGSDGE